MSERESSFVVMPCGCEYSPDPPHRLWQACDFHQREGVQEQYEDEEQAMWDTPEMYGLERDSAEGQDDERT